MSQQDPDGGNAWDAWIGPQKKSIAVSQSFASGCDPARSWSRFGLPTDAGDGFAWNREGWNGYVPPDRVILQLSTAWACITLLSEVMATLPCMFYKTTGDGTRVPDTSHSLYTLLHDQPNADTTSVDFWQICFAWMLMRGAAYIEKDYFGEKIVALNPLFRPGLTWVYENGERIYRYTDPLTGRQRIIPKKNMWRMAAFTLGGREDMSPIAYGARMFRGSVAADEASQRMFESGMMASGFVTMPDGVWLTQEQRDVFKGSLDRFRGARNAGGIFTLEGGAKYQALSMDPEDAQMLETRSFNVEEICRWYRVPPVLVGHGDKTTTWGTGLEQLNIGFLTYTLRTWLRKAESSAKLNLLTPAEKTTRSVEFNVEGLLRGDSKTRSDFYTAMTNAGIYTRDYCRALENLAPMGGNAAKLLVQSQNVPIDKVGEWTADPTGRQLIAIQGIIEAIARGHMPAEAGRAAIQAAIPILTPAQIDEIISPIENFDDVDATPTPDPASQAGGATTAAADAGGVQQTALNGAQVTALQELLIAAATGQLPPETARAAIRAAFPLLTDEEIAAMISPLESFTPAKPEPAEDPINGPVTA